MAFLRIARNCIAQKLLTNINNNKVSTTVGSVAGFSFSSVARKVSAAGAINYDTKIEGNSQNEFPKDPLDLTFSDPVAAFKSKTTWEVLRAYIVYTLCSFDYIVENNAKLMKICRTVLGDSLFKFLMRSTFYGHFVAGEDTVAIRPTLERLRSFGVKPILDYSVEEDISQEEAERREELCGSIIE